MGTKSNGEIPVKARVQFRKQVLQYVRYKSADYKKVYAKGIQVFSGYIRGELEKFIKQKSLKEKTPSKVSLTNFFNPDRDHQPYTRLCNILCQFFWDETIEEWYEKEYLETDRDTKSEYVPHQNWSGIILHYERYTSSRIVPDTNERLEDLIHHNKLTESKKEIWFYGTHFHDSLTATNTTYLRLLEHGASLKFFINRIDYNGSSLALDFKAEMFANTSSRIHEKSHYGITELIYLMREWRNRKYKDATFHETYAPQIEVKLHNRVAGYRGYFLCPDCPDAISVVIPSIDGEASPDQAGWIGDNRPKGLAMRHFEKMRPFWEDSEQYINFKDFLQEGENHNYYEDYPALLADYFNC